MPIMARPETGIFGGWPIDPRIANIDGLDRIRYTTSHPLDMDNDLIAAHGDVPQLMPYLHLPIQLGPTIFCVK